MNLKVISAKNFNVKDPPKHDYMCDGVNDEDEISQAMNYIYHMSGGRLTLIGEFTIDPVKLRGMLCNT